MADLIRRCWREVGRRAGMIGPCLPDGLLAMLQACETYATRTAWCWSQSKALAVADPAPGRPSSSQDPRQRPTVVEVLENLESQMQVSANIQRQLQAHVHGLEGRPPLVLDLVLIVCVSKGVEHL
jgi:hypothetical protein